MAEPTRTSLPQNVPKKLYEFVDSGNTGDYETAGNYRIFQSFTVGTVGDNEPIDISSVAIYIRTKYGNSTGLRVKIFTIDGGGLPDEEIAANPEKWQDRQVIHNTIFGWKEFIMETSTQLQPDTQYVLVVWGTTAHASFTVEWARGSSLYAGGNAGTTSDGGENWNIQSSSDMLFKIYGLDSSKLKTGVPTHIGEPTR